MEFAPNFFGGGGGGGGTFPLAAQVLSGVVYGPNNNDYTGTIVLPAVGDVQQGVTYGAGSASTGTFVVPAIEDVESGVQYGAGGTEFTGTLTTGGGTTDWTADERAAIRAILGIPSSGSTPVTPVSGALSSVGDATLANQAAMTATLASIKAKTDQITSEGQTIVTQTELGRLPQTEVYAFAFNRTTGARVPGIANTITANWRKDGVTAPLADANPIELEDGKYAFSLTDEERTFSSVALLLPECSDPNIEVISLQPVFSMLDVLTYNRIRLATMSGTVQAGGTRRDIVTFVGDQSTVLIPSGDYELFTIEMAFEDANSNRRVATITDGSITKDAEYIEVAPPLQVYSVVRKLRYSVRRTSDKEVLLYGIWEVRDTALA